VADLPADPLLRVPVTWDVRTSHHEGATEPPGHVRRRVDVDRDVRPGRRHALDPGSLAAPGGTTEYDEAEYDAFERLREHTRPTGAVRTIDYAAFERTITDEDLAPVTAALDGRGRVIRSERTVDSVTEAGEASYDAAGRLVSLTLLPGTADETVHAFTYDSLGRLAFATDPDIGDRDLLYDDRSAGRGRAFARAVRGGAVHRLCRRPGHRSCL